MDEKRIEAIEKRLENIEDRFNKLLEAIRELNKRSIEVVEETNASLQAWMKK